MRTCSSKRSRAGLSVTELVVLVAVVGVVGVILLSYIAEKRRVYGSPIRCGNQLMNVGLAFRIFATDNNDMFPADVMVSDGVERTSIDVVMLYGFLSNELSSPSILLCREDKKRKEATSFTNFSAKNISYFASLSAKETLPSAFVAGDRNLTTKGVAVPPGLFTLTTNSAMGWTKELHNKQGEVVMSDGSVHRILNATLQAAVKAQELGANYLAVP